MLKHLTMLVAGADASGFDDTNHRVISFVLGNHENIFSLHKKIGIEKIHMNRLGPQKRQQVIKRLNFDCKERFAISFIVDKMKTVHEIHEHMKRKDKYADIGLVYRQFDALLYQKVRPLLEPITNNFHLKPEEIVLQVDWDMEHTATHWGIKWESRGIAHELSDGLAYCHNFGRDVPGAKLYDFSEKLNSEMKEEMLK